MLRKALQPFREFGPGAGFLYAIDRVLSRVSETWRLKVFELMVQPITGKPLLPGKLGGQLEIREIRPGDPEISSMPVRPEIMKARLAQNATCLGAFRDDEFIGYMWFCTGAYDEDEARVTYILANASESVFDFDFFIFPKHRMGVAFVGLWNAANRVLHERGVRYTFSRLTRFNLASRRAHKHLGWKLVGRAVFLQIGGFEMMLATIAPFVSVSWSRRRRVRMALRPLQFES